MFSRYRYFVDTVATFDLSGIENDEWFVVDDERASDDFEVNCVNKHHAIRVAQALNNILDNAESDSVIMTVSQEYASELAHDLEPWQAVNS